MRLRGGREPQAVTLSGLGVVTAAGLGEQQQTNPLAAAAVHCLTRVPTYKDRQAKEGATRHEGCAVPPNEINDNLLAAVPLAWLTLTSPQLAHVDLGRDCL